MDAEFDLTSDDNVQCDNGYLPMTYRETGKQPSKGVSCILK